MGKNVRRRAEKAATFAAIVADVEADPDVVKHAGRPGVPPADSPFDSDSWVDEDGTEWRVREPRRSQLTKLVSDPAVVVREFDRWTGETRPMSGDRRRELELALADRATELNDDWCYSTYISELYRDGADSEIYVGVEWSHTA